MDVLVLNHGAGVKLTGIEKLKDETIQQIMDINLVSVIKGAREVTPVMKAAGKGHVVPLASACSYHGWPTRSVYTAAKAGLVRLTKCLHVEMSEWGGKATMFVPGAARTGFCDAANIADDWMSEFLSAEDFARTLVHCNDVPEGCFIQEARIWGTAQVPSMVNSF